MSTRSASARRGPALTECPLGDLAALGVEDVEGEQAAVGKVAAARGRRAGGSRGPSAPRVGRIATNGGQTYELTHSRCAGVPDAARSRPAAPFADQPLAFSITSVSIDRDSIRHRRCRFSRQWFDSSTQARVAAPAPPKNRARSPRAGIDLARTSTTPDPSTSRPGAGRAPCLRLMIRSITSTAWDTQSWPIVKVELARRAADARS